MNYYRLALATLTTVILSSSMAIGQISEITNTSIQQTTINLNKSDLVQPHWLTINSTNSLTQLTIKINGKVVQKIPKNNARINLAPFLKKGKNIVSISSSYTSIDTSIKVEFSGINTQIGQETSGSGSLEQILAIDVE